MKLSERYQSILEGPAWHGLSTLQLLEGVSAADATARPLPELHTIAELISHMTAWKGWVVKVLNGETDYTIEINSQQDWPKHESLSEDEWKGLIDTFKQKHEELASMVDGLSEEKLSTIIPGKPFPYSAIVHGALDHDVYHSAQIAIVKKLLARKSA